MNKKLALAFLIISFLVVGGAFEKATAKDPRIPWIMLASVFSFSAARVPTDQRIDSFGQLQNLTPESPEFLHVASGICPQLRTTKKAPSSYIRKKNPLPATGKNVERGKALYQKEAKPTACKMCHGVRGNGNGRLARGLEPAPRNLTCEDTMRPLPDGQLFWIIKNGSKGTAMLAHRFILSDEDIWRIIYYLKSFAR
jgi:mono/diheme cytochrome c family protein